ncbi:EF Tu GTP binding domain-containing protein [Amanita rubescens]|nr:EF Tu GTP binding domain-containing protein [Amanita rubescens]
MGRLLYELGRLDEKTRVSNERASGKLGKSSFSWAWNFDGTAEERERGITMDVGQQSLSTKNRDITILDAPGHRDFIPNMISGASQADCALLVVDAAVGEFEAGFERGGQTREHLLLVRSLGVTQLIVAVNKLDQVQWEQARYNEICAALRPFLTQSGYSMSKASFVPVGAMQGVNLASRDSSDAMELRKWYQGPTLVDLLVWHAAGRICSGVVQVGEKLRVLPGDETGYPIDTEQTNAPWAAAGTNVTLYLTAIDPIQLNVGSVLCSPSALVPLVTTFTARVIVFDIQSSLFHHSRDLPATVSKLLTILDRATGTVTKTNPRVLGKGVSAEVEINLRTASMSGAGSGVRAIPIETFSANKEMGRVLLRRGGETIAAGIILKLAN